jgi:hypothetical protein
MKSSLRLHCSAKSAPLPQLSGRMAERQKAIWCIATYIRIVLMTSKRGEDESWSLGIRFYCYYPVTMTVPTM